MSTLEEVKSTLVALANARSRKRKITLEVKAAEEAIAEINEWKRLAAARMSYTAAGKEVKAAEETARETAVSVYLATKAKGPFFDGAATVMQVVDIEIDRDEFLPWAIREGRTFITVDEKELLSFAKNKRNEIPGVKLIKTPRGKIAGDLSAFETK